MEDGVSEIRIFMCVCGHSQEIHGGTNGRGECLYDSSLAFQGCLCDEFVLAMRDGSPVEAP
jgi:hypothetical protein